MLFPGDQVSFRSNPEEEFVGTDVWREIKVEGPAPETGGLNSWAYMSREKKFLPLTEEDFKKRIGMSNK